MKVTEKGTDRLAFVHLYLDQRIAPLDEYGVFVNPEDKAIECFVPVEDGQQIKVGGRFTGTTMTIGYDVCVDRICRKHHTYFGKQVAFQKNKKLDAEKVLFKNENDDTVEAELLVCKIPSSTSVEEDGEASLGTIEGIDPYYSVIGEGFEEFEESVGYNAIPPEFAMTYQKNNAALDSGKAKGTKRKMGGKRPGSEPWVIFRFHYRSKEAILDAGFPLTFDSDKPEKKHKARELDIEEMPILVMGSTSTGMAPPKKEGLAPSTPTSTAPNTPTKGPTDKPFPTPKTPTTSKPSKLATSTSPAKPQASTDNAASTPAEKSTAESLDSELSEEEGDEDLRTLCFTSEGLKISLPPSSPKSGTMSIVAPTNEMSDVTVAEINGNTNGETVAGVTSNADADTPKTDGEDKVIGEKAAEPKEDDHAGNRPLEDHTPSNTKAKLVNGTKADNGTMTKTVTPKVQKPPKLTNGTAPIPTIEKPEPTPTIEQVTPIKRPAPVNTTISPESKRTKLPPSSEPASRLSSPAPTSKDVPFLAKRAEARKRLQEIKAKREAIAKKQLEIDVKLSPYQQKIQDQIEEMEREADDEARIYQEEEQRLKECEEFLKECEGGEMEI